MKKLFKIVLGLILISITSYAEEKVLYQNEFENGTVYIDVNSYKILQFNKRIKNLQITNSEKIVAEILENKDKPLTTIKIYAKQAGNESSIVTFQDDTIISVGFITPPPNNLNNQLASIAAYWTLGCIKKLATF